MNAPRDDLFRASPFATSRTDIVRADSDGDDGRTMLGFPIVYNSWAEIRGWEGHFMERIVPGAVARSLEKRQPVVMFNHGFDPQIGDKPLGVPSVIDHGRSYGVYWEVPLSRTSYNEDLLALMRDGALWGESFRFSVKRDDWADTPPRSAHNPEGLPERTIFELSWMEGGPVTFPAYQATTLGVRSREQYVRFAQDLPAPLADPGAVSVDDGSPILAPVTSTKARVARILRADLSSM